MGSSRVRLCKSVALFLPARFAFVTIVIAVTATTSAVTTTTTTATAASTAVAATAAAATSIGSRLGFVDGQISAAEVLAVKRLDSCCCLFRGCHFHKSKAA